MPDSGNWRKNRWEVAGWILFAALLVGFVPMAISRTTTKHTSGDRVHAGTDFWEFDCSARHVWQDGVRPPDSKFSHYLPSVDVSFGLLARMPFSWPPSVWLAIMIAAWLCLFGGSSPRLCCCD